MKYVVYTTGSFMLVDPTTGLKIKKPVLSSYNDFVTVRHASGEINALIGYRFPDNAKDEAFQGFLKECNGDVEMATAAYYSTFDLPEVDTDAFRAVQQAKRPSPKELTKTERKQAAKDLADRIDADYSEAVAEDAERTAAAQTNS